MAQSKVNVNIGFTLDSMIFKNLKSPRISNWVSDHFANDLFTHNVRQVAGSIIRIARGKTTFKKEMKRYVNLLETEPREQVVDKPSESKL